MGTTIGSQYQRAGAAPAGEIGVRLQNVMIRLSSPSVLSFLLAVFPALTLAAAAQRQPDEPVANPGRPTVSTPATLTPVGYLQFETGFLGATHSPRFPS